MIFVQIASYRDTQLLPTINNALSKADFPCNIVFGIVDQSGSDFATLDLGARHKYLKIDPALSKGVCWARNLANTLYDGEEYYLQIDSHTRFDAGWDTTLISQLNSYSCHNPVISCYPSTYTIDANGSDVIGPKFVAITRPGTWTDGIVSFASSATTLSVPQDAISVAGGFIFAHGNFVTSVPYDPEIYFAGEELVLSIQAYTRGFNLVHPVDCPLYHYYIRNNESKHWTDHLDWSKANNASLAKVRSVINGEAAGYFGNARSLKQYEQFAGISFATQSVVSDIMQQHQFATDK